MGYGEFYLFTDSYKTRRLAFTFNPAALFLRFIHWLLRFLNRSTTTLYPFAFTKRDCFACLNPEPEPASDAFEIFATFPDGQGWRCNWRGQGGAIPRAFW